VLIIYNHTEHLPTTSLLDSSVIPLITLDEIDQRAVVSVDLPAFPSTQSNINVFSSRNMFES